MPDIKTYTLFAGPNGAGKSTFYKKLMLDKVTELGLRINTDEIIKQHFNHDWQSPNTQINAGRIAVKMIRECLTGDASFNQETTLTGKSIIKNITKAKDNGFCIRLFYVGLENHQLSVERVAKRVEQGGHGIPTDVLLRRYSVSLENLRLVLPICNHVQIYDNSVSDLLNFDKPHLIVNNEKVTYYSNDCPQYLKNILTDYVVKLS